MLSKITYGSQKTLDSSLSALLYEYEPLSVKKQITIRAYEYWTGLKICKSVFVIYHVPKEMEVAITIYRKIRSQFNTTESLLNIKV